MIASERPLELTNNDRATEIQILHTVNPSTDLV